MYLPVPKIPFKNRRGCMTQREATLLSLVDGAYTQIELYRPDPVNEPYNVRWREEWLRKAREMGAYSD